MWMYEKGYDTSFVRDLVGHIYIYVGLLWGADKGGDVEGNTEGAWGWGYHEARRFRVEEAELLPDE